MGQDHNNKSSRIKRRMIRLDDLEDQQDTAQDNEQDQHVAVTQGRVAEFMSKGGFTWQRCGGGRRRLPKRTN